MTSRTGPTRKRRRASILARPPGGRLAAKPLRPRRGFTLLEVLLALGILVLLLGMVAVNFPAMRSSHTLEEGADRLATALRMARADAANSGRRLRLAFDAEEGRPRVLWEPSPLTEPGQFVEYGACAWQELMAVDGVAVATSRFVGSSAYRALGDATAKGAKVEDADLAPVTFEPNGSSDSVVIELVATDAPETRRARVEIDGLTGTVTSRILTLEELQEE